jgi:hypothetical protein
MQADTTADTTTDKLAEMLTENTGRSFLDSGDYYGRNWEQNQGADFESRPEGRLEFWIPGGEYNGELDIVPTVNVYHFLKDRLEYTPELDQRYREYVEREDVYLDINSALSFVETLAADTRRVRCAWRIHNARCVRRSGPRWNGDFRQRPGVDLLQRLRQALGYLRRLPLGRRLRG